MKWMEITRRRLPHYHAIGGPLFITFRLHGSLPAGRYFGVDTVNSGQAFVLMDRLLDGETCGPLYLRRPEIVELVAAEIKRGAGAEYDLHAWVVMPNHVHLLITPLAKVSNLMQGIKGVTAREANKVLGLTGQRFWQRESVDRLVRDREEFRRVERYIVQNPVAAGLADCAEEFRWSSAWVAERD